MPPKIKKHSATQHDRRHENGLARPGRRIVRPRSNSNLNGIANGKSPLPSPSLPAEAVARQDPHTPSAPHAQSNGAAEQSNLHGECDGCGQEGRNLDADPVVAGVDELVVYTRARANSDMPEEARTGDTTPQKQTGTLKPSRASVIDLYPIRDVVAILLLLLQLPPMAVTAVHVCFAVLTFVPPFPGWSLSSFTSSHEWLHSFGGNPSLLTTAMSDITALLLWLVLPIAQDVTLDMSLGVIAVSLSGGVASRSGTTPNILLCSTIIALSNLFQYNGPRQHGVNLLWSILSKTSLGRARLSSSPPILQDYRYAARGWPRTILELHILAQGIVRIVRRHFSEPRSRLSDQHTYLSNSIVSSVTGNETVADGARNSSTDGRLPGPPPILRDGREMPSGRKRRKLALHVRSQQPFWAALASTKISFFKDLEQSSAAQDSYEAQATDTSHLGDGCVSFSEGRVWITEVNATNVHFAAMLPSTAFPDPEDGSAASQSDTDDELMAPLAVRVNGAMWSSIENLTVEDRDEQMQVFKARIFGLTESSTYLIDFIRESDDQVLHSASIFTLPLAATEQSSTIAVAPQSLRPSSPITTLRNSVSATESTLSEHRQKLKSKRKDHKSATTALKREVDNLSNRLSTAGGNDDKQKQKQLQIHQHIRQAEDVLSSTATQLEELGAVPKDELRAFESSKARWQELQARLEASQKQLDSTKSEADRQVAAAKSDTAATVQKRERLQARLAKLTQQYETSLAAHTEHLKGMTRREQDRASKLAGYRHAEQSYLGGIAALEHKLQEFQFAALQASQQAHFIQSSLAHHTSHGTHSMSAIPEAPDLPPSPTHPAHIADGSFARSRPGSTRGARERASSMLSNVSGLTDEVTASPTAAHVPAHAPGSAAAMIALEHSRGRQGSDSSAGWSGKGSGSRSGSGSVASGPASQWDLSSPKPGKRGSLARVSPKSRE